MLYRKIRSYIDDHLSSKEDKILLIEGARQIGKSYIIRDVGRNLYDNYVEINFVEDDAGDKIFRNVRTTEEFYLNLRLDMAERMAKRHIPMTMEDWAKRIDIILEAGGDAILSDAGKVTAEFAKKFAETEFEKYRVIQDRLFSSDFDRFNDGDNLLPFEINSDNE